MKFHVDAAKRPCWIPAFVMVLALCRSPAALADTPVAPFYSLPSPGVWIEFDCVDLSRDGKETPFKLRLAHAGEVEHVGMPHAWVEIKLTNTSDTAESWKLRKLLVSLPAYKQHGALAKSLSGAHQQNGPGKESKALTPAE